MAIAFCSIQVSESSDDLACSGFAVYAVRCDHLVGTPACTDHKHRYGGESALRPSTPPLTVRWNDAFSPPLSCRERTGKVHGLKQRLRDRIWLLPATLPARQYRQLVDDWVHGCTQSGVSLIVPVHAVDHGAGYQDASPLRRRRS